MISIGLNLKQFNLSTLKKIDRIFLKILLVILLCINLFV